MSERRSDTAGRCTFCGGMRFLSEEPDTTGHYAGYHPPICSVCGKDSRGGQRQPPAESRETEAGDDGRQVQ